MAEHLIGDEQAERLRTRASLGAPDSDHDLRSHFVTVGEGTILIGPTGVAGKHAVNLRVGYDHGTIECTECPYRWEGPWQ